MITKVVTPIDKEMIQVAGERLLEGALVAFPTETVYGLGAHPANLEAVRSIYELKGRDFSKPLGLHISSVSTASFYAKGTDSEVFQRLTTSFWPGPLTIVLPKKETVSDEITAGLNTIALRFPSHPVGIEFIEAAGGAVVGTSANVSGGFSATSVKDVRHDLEDKIPYIISGDAGMLGVESTVLSISFDEQGKETLSILRKGAIGERMINRTLGYEALAVGGKREHIVSESSDCEAIDSEEIRRSKDKKIRFYRARDLLKVVQEASSCDEVRVIVFKEQIDRKVVSLLQNSVLKKRSRVVSKMKFLVNFYKVLRGVDSEVVSVIYVPRLEEAGIEESIMSLLSKY